MSEHRGNKVRHSLIRPKPLKRERFKTLQQRDAYILEKRYEGYTLEEIGESVGLTRESIRLIVKKKNGPTQKEVLSIRKAKYRSEVLEVISEETLPTRSSITSRLAISQEKLNAILGNKVKSIPGNEKHKKRIYTDKDLLKILSTIASLTDQKLSAAKFTELCGEPTIAVFLARFGSWKMPVNLREYRLEKVERVIRVDTQLKTCWHLLRVIWRTLEQAVLPKIMIFGKDKLMAHLVWHYYASDSGSGMT